MAESKAGGVLQMGKHLQLSKAQTTTLVAAGVGIFVVVFTIFAVKSLLGQHSYQGRVISAQHKALDQLKENEKTASALAASYKNFVSQSVNAIGGSSTGDGSRDGNNGRLILDALPPKYDFPALTSSLEKMITGQNMQIKGISGEDDQASQQDNTSSSSPQPVEMPFSVSAAGSVDQVKSLIGQFEHSIRPFQIQTIQLKGDQNNMTVSVTAQTYYQPAKNFNIKKEPVE